MKLRRVQVTNARSFLDCAELKLDGNISIIIGPNGGGKTNLLDVAITSLRRELLKSWVVTRVNQGPNLLADQFTINDQIANAQIEKHSGAENQPQTASLP
jgi:putative ATP-dependent endonuclease of OLD family